MAFLHDLNNLLMAANGYALLLRDDLDGGSREFAARIVTATDSAKALVARFAATLPSPADTPRPRLLLVLTGPDNAGNTPLQAGDRLVARLEGLGIDAALADGAQAAVLLAHAPDDWDAVAGPPAVLAGLYPGGSAPGDWPAGPVRVELPIGLDAVAVEAAVRHALRSGR